MSDLKSSAVAWGGRDTAGEDSPPAYSGAGTEVASHERNEQIARTTAPPRARRPIPRIPYDPLRKLAPFSNIPFNKYNIPDGTLSPDNVSLTVKHSDLYAHPQHLLPFVLEQAYLPPKPTLRIVGSHYGSRVDFDLTLNLTHLLDLRNSKWRFNSAQVSPIGGSRVLYVRDDPTAPTRVAQSVKQFCFDKSENKSFTLTRSVDGLPTEMLAGQVRNLAASVKYRGLLRIEFIDERSKVIVHKQPSSWFSNMLRLHPEKKYEVVETVWNLSDGTEEGSEQNPADTGLRAAQEWWQSWASTLRNAIICKHRGNVGIDDWIETKMGRLEPEPRVEWGVDAIQ